MTTHYDTESTSRDSARVDDIVITKPDEVEQGRTRRIMRPLLIDNARNKAASVKLTLMHQRRHSAKDPWEDADSFNLATLRAGQEVRLELSAGQTYRLYQALSDLYALSQDGVPQGQRRFIAVDGESGVVVNLQTPELVEYLLANDNPEFWEALNQLKPDVLTAVALKQQHERRSAALAEFKAQLAAEEWSEGNWQSFFEANTWIFGHGLAYQFLHSVTKQPAYGGVTVAGSGGQRGDFLLATAATIRFIVLVDIKKPQSELLTTRLYRNKVWGPSSELSGGAAQLQSNCRTWVIEGSRQDENRDLLHGEDIYTYEPKGILVIGNTRQLDDTNKRASFELFRRNLHNPEIITYDELLARAEYLVVHQEQ
ncbi:DUF4263 domain-containing protein [Candidatus Chloroploca sp. M-50]|uniref:DUF4263 domain-containing protein n=1 Tax=Candidatus Chloroploca mongolica TaxID=2528176 RepID=A0ABS4D9W3_9CHLR|nr:Shedu immune nuclease family protein [Candidatus Chloroploca mongolica]MBP1466238.1 DUF4263 domain-containing protein [Candidatus Chloroploca mongolica]